ncbi:glycosyltransferase [Jeotgalibaca porci]|uniref:glycosyltransferase n=1 Tax=Jeotgalibaca porci TaxID=1868793 RepID=UPI003F8E581D
MISVICCYSDKNKLDNMLLKGLEKQSVDFEPVFVDNTNGKFTSAAAALNYGFEQSSGDYLVFIHQDVMIDDSELLRKITGYLDTIKGEVIVGAAGIKEKNGVYSNITHGNEKKVVGKYRLTEPQKVQTLDEVLIAIKRDIFSKLLFDAAVCDNWHLYGVELCLNGARHGIESYVIPLTFHHYSKGTVDYNYMQSLGKVIKKHRDFYSDFITTITPVKTKHFHPYLFFKWYKFKHYLAPKLKKIGISKNSFKRSKE